MSDQFISMPFVRKLERTYADTGRASQAPRPGSKQGTFLLWGHHANHHTTVSPVFHIKYTWMSKQGFWLNLLSRTGAWALLKEVSTITVYAYRMLKCDTKTAIYLRLDHARCLYHGQRLWWGNPRVFYLTNSPCASGKGFVMQQLAANEKVCAQVRWMWGEMMGREVNPRGSPLGPHNPSVFCFQS